MKKFEIITIFPEIFESYFGESILKRAQGKKLIQIGVHDLRLWSKNKHRKVDDSPYGGGAGMVLQVEPIAGAIETIKKKGRKLHTRTILFSAKGKRYDQRDAKRLLGYDRLILVCGRYEGVDERVAKEFVDEELSIGDYVLTGGEIPAMILVDSVSRLIPGVLGNALSAESESHSQAGLLEYPQYTKPEDFRGLKVPKVLLSGNHQEIEKWRKKNSRLRAK